MASPPTFSTAGGQLLPKVALVAKRVGTGTTRQGRGLVCRAVEVVDFILPFVQGNRFQLDDVIEAQQFDRDILNAIFEVARNMEKIEKNSPEAKF
ncbi:hypothetical protein MLD38_024912 [Melastoma candidum]|uniref:Uncharacterized protein n=1 Tax=Melastoma candidum TaxID=119954 RepID=A0ACB9NYV9_9MYRT|nr:hypothetical protein MLD38_024912 [Melastoma candidum]